MIIETGRIMAIEAEGLWVETIQQSTCSSCRAEPGCGQSLLAKTMGRTSYLWVLLEGRDPTAYQLGEEVQIGVPEEVVAKGSLFVYLTPLVGLMLGAGAAHSLWGSELLTFLAAMSGLVAAGLLVRWHAHLTRFDPRLQPVLVDDRQRLNFVEPHSLTS